MASSCWRRRDPRSASTHPVTASHSSDHATLVSLGLEPHSYDPTSRNLVPLDRHGKIGKHNLRSQSLRSRAASARGIGLLGAGCEEVVPPPICAVMGGVECVP